jgi:lysophospholipase L1-like esterase
LAFLRYVAIGDSTTEGLDDPDGRGGYRGWANRLAEALAQDAGGRVLYANLAVRGRSARAIREEQLDKALAMRPDVASAVAGMNDLVRPRFDADAVAKDVEAMLRALIAGGATVVTFSLPDLSRVLPLARPLSGRVRGWGRTLRDVCERTGARYVDFTAHDVAADPRLWSDDRFHANASGHALIARALGHALGLPGSDDSWQRPELGAPAAAGGLAAEARWWRTYFVPWMWRHARGRSSGDGRGPKRPELSPFPD